jgi:hypothetical protein
LPRLEINCSTQCDQQKAYSHVFPSQFKYRSLPTTVLIILRQSCLQKEVRLQSRWSTHQCFRPPLQHSCCYHTQSMALRSKPLTSDKVHRIGSTHGRACRNWSNHPTCRPHNSYVAYSLSALCKFSLTASQSSGGVLKDATLRQTLHMSVGAPKIKITISNTFGGSDLPITAGSVGLPAGDAAGVSGIQASPLAAITVGGKSSFTVPRGQVVTSDEIAFEVKPQSMLTVSLYSQQGQSGTSITGHPGSRTTSWFVSGNKVNATSFTGTSSVHWYETPPARVLKC